MQTNIEDGVSTFNIEDIPIIIVPETTDWPEIIIDETILSLEKNDHSNFKPSEDSTNEIRNYLTWPETPHRKNKNPKKGTEKMPYVITSSGWKKIFCEKKLTKENIELEKEKRLKLKSIKEEKQKSAKANKQKKKINKSKLKNNENDANDKNEMELENNKENDGIKENLVHFSCAKKIKKCCGLTLAENESSVEDALNGITSDNMLLLKLLVTELRMNNKLLMEKMEAQEVKLEEKDTQIEKLQSKINFMENKQSCRQAKFKSPAMSKTYAACASVLTSQDKLNVVNKNLNKQVKDQDLYGFQAQKMNEIINLASDQVPNSETSNITYKKNQNKVKPKIGTANNNLTDCTFAGREETGKKAWLFISRVKDSTTEEDVKKYVCNKTKTEADDVVVKTISTSYKKKDTDTTELRDAQGSPHLRTVCRFGIKHIMLDPTTGQSIIPPGPSEEIVDTNPNQGIAPGSLTESDTTEHLDLTQGDGEDNSRKPPSTAEQLGASQT
ncbi:unnamed protein product [Brassicogethes aeneus]|uniref:Uncharacterized protein n=1 Tax=Brassicogethes aeneus TaxID=1431903 RepID=A0A9P0B061_BRAAE|nr:unnamed protein product [Brassicogethes aeneus]